MPDSIALTVTLPATPAQVYDAWLNGPKHAAMTGAEATSSPEINGQFAAWDGYIWGHYVALRVNEQITMAWKTAQFPAEAPFSRVSIALEAAPKGTKLTLRHGNIPDGPGVLYKSGWKKHYFDPMKRYFSGK